MTFLSFSSANPHSLYLSQKAFCFDRLYFIIIRYYVRNSSQHILHNFFTIFASFFLLVIFVIIFINIIFIEPKENMFFIFCLIYIYIFFLFNYLVQIYLVQIYFSFYIKISRYLIKNIIKTLPRKCPDLKIE